MDEKTPDEMDLQNCETADKAWLLLDAKYGNDAIITEMLIDELVKCHPKVGSPEFKLVDFRTTLVRVDTELTAINGQTDFSISTLIHKLFVKQLAKLMLGK